jgi:hypothetical protein
VRRIFVRDLTETTHGNAVGIGFADFTTDRLVEKIDFKTTYINAVTGTHISVAAIPFHLPTDREILDVAFQTAGLLGPADVKVMWIKNTLHLREVEISTAFLETAQERPDLEILTGPRPLQPGPDGNLPPFEVFGDGAA